jgi:hypothetical protein
MRILYLFLIFGLISNSIHSQSVTVSGECMTGTIALTYIGDIDGKPAYEGSGTVDGNAGVQVDVYWMPAPDNLWVLAYDGQPYFQNSCNTALPWGTVNVSCPWDPVSGQPCTGGSPLTITGSGALVVHLISFTAKVNNGQVIVNWKTATETNNKGFYIQRSMDGVNWKNLGFVKGNINSATASNYQFTDAGPLPGRNLYRLLQVDLDNKSSYSSVAAVNIVKSGFYFVSNNPGNGLYNLHLEAGSEKVDFLVTDAAGRVIISKANNDAGDQTIDISTSPSGIYLLRLKRGADFFTEKLVKL